jgi:hypothetical protein
MKRNQFTDLETVKVTIDSVGITPPPGTTGTGPKSRLCKECPAPAAEASGRMLDKLEVGLLREPTAYNWNRPPWMFQYPVVGNPWQPSAALGAPSQAVSGGLCPTSQDPLDSVRELLSGYMQMNSPKSNHKKPQNWKKAF